MNRTWIYVALAVVAIILVYFLLIKKKKACSCNDRTVATLPTSEPSVMENYPQVIESEEVTQVIEKFG